MRNDLQKFDEMMEKIYLGINYSMPKHSIFFILFMISSITFHFMIMSLCPFCEMPINKRIDKIEFILRGS